MIEQVQVNYVNCIIIFLKTDANSMGLLVELFD